MKASTRRHGTRSCYVLGCRRPECVAAHTAYTHDYYVRYRRPLEANPPVNPAAAVAHVAHLRAAGMGYPAIAAASGVGIATLRTLTCRKGILARTERAILAVQPAPWRRDATGARRRVQVLGRLGWSQDRIAAAANVDRKVISEVAAGAVRQVYPTTDDGIRTAYDQLSMRPGPSAVARRHAVTKGWAPPLAWDDIDDPTETPNTGARPKGRLVDLDDWCHLVSLNVNPDEAARRCGVADMDSIEMAAVRHNHAPALRWLAALTLARNAIDGNGRETVDILASRARRLRALADQADQQQQEGAA